MKKVVVIFGSKSKEHEVSCISAGNILSNIDRDKFEVSMIGIDKDGNWFKYTGDIKTVFENKWLEDANHKEKIENVLGELKKYDLAFPVLHGKYGEDGTIQGLFEMAGVKYAGSKVMGSSIAVDKHYSKILVEKAGIPVVEYVIVEAVDLANIDKIEIPFEYPVIVKPAREGSSYGIFKADSRDKLKEAIEKSFEFDSKLLIEKYIEKRLELEVGVLGNYNNLEFAGPCQITTKDGIYDYQTKYINDKADVKTMADLSEDIKENLKQMSRIIYKEISLCGLARVDFFLDLEDNMIYFNEVNTMPGFTNSSMFPIMFTSENMAYKDLITKIIECGLK